MESLHERIKERVEMAISRRLFLSKEAGYTFISDQEIDDLVNNVLAEEVGGITERAYYSSELKTFRYTKDYYIDDVLIAAKGEVCDPYSMSFEELKNLYIIEVIA